MITVISGVNRPGSRTRKVVDNCMNLLAEKGAAHQLLDLCDLPLEVFAGAHYGNQHPAFQAICDTHIVPVKRFLIVSPEYNGSIPGILKCLIDYSEVKSCWTGKKAALVGVAAGRAGNLRGLDHLTNILLHLKTTVCHNKLPLSGVQHLLDENGKLDEATLGLLGHLLDDLLEL